MRLIDADALLERFNEKCDVATAIIDDETSKRFHKFCVIADALEDCPTVDADLARHGHWVEKENSLVGKYMVCSACNAACIRMEEDEIHLSVDMPFAKYCPNCGAKMEG